MPGYAKPPSYNANNISITPAGNISSTTLQAGIEELDSEKTTESYVNTTAAAVPTGSKNLIYNGAMQVAQRGTSLSSTTTGGYLSDRWVTGISGCGTWDISVENDGPSGSGFSKSSKLLCTTANSSLAANEQIYFAQRLEGNDLQIIAKGSSEAKQLTLSFWVKSNVTGTYVIWLYDEDNLREVTNTYTVNSSATWEKKEVTFPADTIGAFDNDNGRSMWVTFYLAAGPTYTSGSAATSWQSLVSADRAVGQTNLAAATNNYWQVTGVQLEVGDTATDFEHKPFGVELARCQRYFCKSYNPEDAPGTNTVDGSVSARFSSAITNRVDIGTTFPVTMRAKADVTIYSEGGTSGVVSDLGTGTTEVGTHAVSYVIKRGCRGWSGLVFSSAVDDGIACHYTADAEL